MSSDMADPMRRREAMYPSAGYSTFGASGLKNENWAGARVRPDWVMLGWRNGGRCFLMASETVLSASMGIKKPQQHHFRSWEEFTRPGAFKPVATVEADVQGYTIITAATYAECLAALLFGHQWRPDQTPPAITEGLDRP